MPTATLEKKLEIVRGPFAEVLLEFDPSTIAHASEIMKLRQTDEGLCHQWLWTADFPMYLAKDGEAVLYLASGEYNLIFMDVQNALSQLLNPHIQNYFPSKEGIAEVVGAAKDNKVMRVALSKLGLQEYNDEYSFFEIKTDKNDYDSLNEYQKKMVDKIYGYEGLQLLNKNGIGTTRMHVLNPSYVKKQLKGKDDSAIARASWLGSFITDSRFVAASLRVVGFPYFGLLGIRSIKSAENTAKIQETKNPYFDYDYLTKQQGI